MSDFFEKFFSQKRGHTKALPQELHLIPQLLGNFDELIFYKKGSGRRKIIYEVIFLN